MQLNLREMIPTKLTSVILTPVLTAVLLVLNAYLPVPLTSEQISELVEWIIKSIMTFVVTQGAVDITRTIIKKEPKSGTDHA